MMNEYLKTKNTPEQKKNNFVLIKNFRLEHLIQFRFLALFAFKERERDANS